MSAKKYFENTVGNGEIARNEQFLFFPPRFLTFWRTFRHINFGPSVGRPYLVRMIARHRIDIGLSNVEQTCVSGCRMITRHRVDLGFLNLVQKFVLESK